LREFHITDDNFTARREYVADFCERVAALPMRFDWACPNGVRLDTLDEATLRAMERSGCYSVAVGIESGRQRVLDCLDKRLELETVAEQLRLIRRATGIRVTGFFILGLPIEEEADIRATVALACALPLARADFFNFNPFPGSRLYDELAAAGKASAADFSRMFIHRFSYAPPALGRRRLAWLTFAAHWRFYLRPHILRGLARELRGPSQMGVILARVGRLLAGFVRPAAH
jgi:radical SAM superfamily enzyme YgiQ (UPF0313 family)